MIRLVALPLPARAHRYLRQYQTGLDAIVDYAERVSKAKNLFSQRNKNTNATFRTVRQKLQQMCSGHCRCAYCEDSCADEVEHVKPKNLYPEATFVWENYVYACEPCNIRKSSNFAVFRSGDGVQTDVTRARNAPVTPPTPGEPVLIDPRHENPLDYMELDLLGTFFFLPRLDGDARMRARAKYTIDMLELNTREHLPAARRTAYINYRSVLSDYITRRDLAESAKQLNRLIDALQHMAYQAVWHEMKRQHTLIPELQTLFTQAPEVLDW